MNRFLRTLFALLICQFSVDAAPGDTTIVEVHDGVDMTWYGNYDQKGAFPNGSVTYEKVLMEYTLGCASSGCSDWDYTTQIFLREPTGMMDSSIASIDTISQNPLIIDTTYNVFEVIEHYELGRVITPYGGYMANGSNGYNNNWKHRFMFDVTDYQTKLRDSVEIRAHYSGWSSGFSVKLRFIFIEGVPPRTVLHVENLYRGGFGYPNSATFEAQSLPERTVLVPAGTAAARLHVITSGHGFDNNVGCAEFCQRYYRIFTNTVQRAQVNMWRNDCGLNPIYPQGGTWLYDRADWCPGLDVEGHNHEIGDFLNTGANTIDMDVQSYGWTGTQTPTHIISNTLFLYSSVNKMLDASIDAIISPSDHEHFRRYNPSVHRAMVKVENRGSQPITSLDFSYHVGQTVWTHSWSGNIEYGEKAVIELPLEYGEVMQSADQMFEVSITAVNGGADETAYNNTLRSHYELPPVWSGDFFLELRTNAVAFQNAYSIVDSDGNLVFERTTMANNTTYRDTFDLSPGAYIFRLTDSGKNGLSWWANNEGSGFARFRQIGGPFLRIFQPDFGTEIYFPFVMEWGVGEAEFTSSMDVNVYPNPAQSKFYIEVESAKSGDVLVEVQSATGQLVWRGATGDGRVEVDAQGWASGIYMVRCSANGATATKRIQIQ